MRGVLVALTAFLGFVAGYVGTAVIAFLSSIESECDGPCFSKADEYTALAVVVGLVCGIGCGWGALRLARRSKSR